MAYDKNPHAVKPEEYGFPLKLKKQYENFIGGEWVAPVKNEYYDNLTPVTGEVLCKVASSSTDDIELALDAAHKAKGEWGKMPVQQRANLLLKVADRMEQNIELLANAETWDNGKPIRETSGADVPLAIDHFRYFASCIRAQEGGISEIDSETVAYHFHEPLGVVAQIIPAIAADVAQLHVFQRSAHWVLPRPDRHFSALERRLLGFKPAYTLLRWLIYWQLESRIIAFKYSRPAMALVQRQALRLLKRQVPDPQLRHQLTPDYSIGCKRVILSNTLYPALGRANVSLHGREQGIQSLDASGINTRDGQHLELDLIIWCTGFDTTDGMIAYPVRGKDRQLLRDAWAPYPRAYLGTCVPGFPNLFILCGPNTGIGHTSLLFIIESQTRYILSCIRALKTQGLQAIEARPEAEARYTAMIHREMQRTVWQSGGCQSWYRSSSGHVTALFPGFSFSYHWLTRGLKPVDHQLS